MAAGVLWRMQRIRPRHSVRILKMGSKAAQFVEQRSHTAPRTYCLMCAVGGGRIPGRQSVKSVALRYESMCERLMARRRTESIAPHYDRISGLFACTMATGPATLLRFAQSPGRAGTRSLFAKVRDFPMAPKWGF